MSASRIEIPEHVMARQLGDECVMLDLESGTYFGLDPIGARVWQLLCEGRAVEEVCDALAEEYEAPRAAIATDVERLLDELAAQGLIVRG